MPLGDSTFRLQTLVLPKADFPAPEDMYVRLFGPTPRAEHVSGVIRLDRGDLAVFDTYFNGISVEAWKRECDIDNLFLCMKGRGRFFLRFGVHAIGAPDRVLDEREIELTSDVEVRVEMRFWSSLERGLLYLSVVSLEDGSVLHGGFFATQTKPAREVKLGIVITHFNRKDAVLPAIRRLGQLLEERQYKGRIGLVVVDNSSNICADERGGAIVIPNRNLGGSGGFCRGLMHLEDDGTYTHCLFMDDDASCEVESIRRAYALLLFARNPNTAVAGALLRELEPYRVHEVGAWYDGHGVPIKHGMDTRLIYDLLRLEHQSQEAIGYGGWWFFAFNLQTFRRYPFPFFVKGDDVMFGLMNDFNIVTMNGISTWGEDFHYKESPLTRYLGVRAHLVNNIVCTNRDVDFCVGFLTEWFENVLFSYHYESARAMTLALRHVMEGPRFFADNLDTQEIRTEINGFWKLERLRPITRPRKIVYSHKTNKYPIREFVRRHSLQGFLLPSYFWKKRTLFQTKGYWADLKSSFKFQKIHYEHEPLGIGFVLEYDRKRGLKEMRDFRAAIVEFRRRFPALKAEYLKQLPYLTSREFWQNVHQEVSSEEIKADPPVKVEV